MAVTIDGEKLQIEDVVRVARRGAAGDFETAALDARARQRIAATRAYIDANWMHDDAPLMYAFNTGVGLFKDQRVTMADMPNALPFTISNAVLTEGWRSWLMRPSCVPT